MHSFPSVAGSQGRSVRRWARIWGVVLAIGGMAIGSSVGAVKIDLVGVGDANNVADTATGYGAVSYAFAIGKYEVTWDQYCAFLNAKAKTDTYGLFNSNMSSNVRGGITRTGSSGAYVYQVKSGYGSKPVLYVSFLDAMRFANWLHNGQGSGDTETGAYTLATGGLAPRNAGAKVWIASENEWYKAAYYDPADTTLTTHYWKFPTRTNSGPAMALPNSTNPNSANFGSVTASPYVTDVGAYTLATNYYGTFDQGGNVQEWLESIEGTGRAIRGGSYLNSSYAQLRSSDRTSATPDTEGSVTGFRIASVPIVLTDSTGAVKNWYTTVQLALNAAQPGDTVKLKSGTYFEYVTFPTSGTVSSRITLQGEAGATLDGTFTTLTFNWQPAPDIAPGVYRCTPGRIIYHLVVNGKSVPFLRESLVQPGAAASTDYEWPNIFANGLSPTGFTGIKAAAMQFAATGELIIRFDGDLDPSTLDIKGGGSNKTHPLVTINKDYCSVSGLHLTNAQAGVWVTTCSSAVVENCRSDVIDYGVMLDSASTDAIVRNNEFSWDPYAGASYRKTGASEFWHYNKTGGWGDRYGVRINMTVGGHQVYSNYIHDGWDGISASWQNEAVYNQNLDIHHNYMNVMADDSMETGGGEINCRWHENVVDDSQVGIRIKAPSVGPGYIYKNVLFNCSEGLRNYGEVTLQPAVMYIYHNTSVSTAAIYSNKVFGIGTPNYHYINNFFWCKWWWGNSDGTSVNPNWEGDYNVYVQSVSSGGWANGKALAASLGMETHSKWVALPAVPGFIDFDNGDLSITESSPARQSGVDLSTYYGDPLPGCPAGYFTGAAPDVGAILYGQGMPVGW